LIIDLIVYRLVIFFSY